MTIGFVAQLALLGLQWPRAAAAQTSAPAAEPPTEPAVSEQASAPTPEPEPEPAEQASAPEPEPEPVGSPIEDWDEWDEDEFRPPRTIAEIASVLFGVSPRVDGETVIGLSFGATQAQGVPPFGNGIAFGLSGLSESVLSHGLFSLHMRSALGIGYGSNLTYGVMEQTVDAGVRVPVLPKGLGLYARGGIDAGAFGDARLYTSRVTFPYGRGGVSVMGKKWLLESGVALGPVLSGRFNVGDDGVRELPGGFEIGPTVLLSTKFMLLSGELRRIGKRDSEPLWLGRAAACGMLRDFSVSMCMHFSYGQGEVFQREERVTTFASSFFGGWTVGYLVN